MNSPLWSPFRTPWRKVCGSNEQRLVTEWKEALGSWTVQNSMACIPQVPWYGLCNALPMSLMAQVICPLLYITVRDCLFCSNLSNARPQASSHPGSVICGRPVPLTSVHFLYGKPIGPKARLLYTYPYTSVSFDTFISCNSKRMGIQIGVFICSEFCLLCSLIYRLCKMENTRDWLNAVFPIFSVTNRIC